jgi:hypothetical protein
MKIWSVTATLTGLLLASIFPGAIAQDKPAGAAPASSPPVEYRPPSRGAPNTRYGGSTRGLSRGLSLAVIAPDHTGLSATDQPELFWYISQPVTVPLEFTVAAVDADDALLQTAIPPVAEAGIQRIRLADYKVKLAPGQEYQWLISFAAKPGSKAKDAIASGRVRVQPASTPLSGYQAYARAGYWYDAIASLRAEMAQRPNDAVLADAQQKLLEQVGLTEVARQERERAPR